MGRCSKFWRKQIIFAFFIPLFLVPLALGMECRAAQGYTYTVTFYPGNHGIFQGTAGLSIGSSSPSVEAGMEGDAIRVSGLRNGDIVSFDAAAAGAVTLEEGSRYYVKGIRLSGHDNNTIDTAAFRVEGDRDYVVAYGIRGDMTGYTVNYQDESGNALAPSRSYYGNVGDKPVVAFLYVEGYEPMAYNLTKTLVSNEAENVFTFVYRRTPVSGGDGPSGGGGTGGIAGNASNGINGVQAGNEGNGNEGENIELDDEEVPLDLMELDEEEMPLASNVLEGAAGMEEGSRIFAASAALVIASVGVLIFFAFWMKRNSKK